MIMATPVESANLILKLYELRREPVMREARNIFMTFDPRSVEDYMAGYDGPEQRPYPDGHVLLGNGCVVCREWRDRCRDVR